MRRTVLAVSLMAGLYAREVERCMQPEAVWSLHALSDVQMDPAGRRVAVVEERTDIQKDSIFTRIVLTEMFRLGSSPSFGMRWRNAWATRICPAARAVVASCRS